VENHEKEIEEANISLIELEDNIDEMK